MFDALKNFSYGTVLTAPSPATSGTSLVLNSGQGANFPAPSTNGPFNLVVWPAGALPLSSNAEIVRCTARSTDTLTITRAQEASSARTVIVGDQVSLGPTANTIARMALYDASLPDGAVAHNTSRFNFFQAIGASNGNVTVSRGEKSVLLPGDVVNSIKFEPAVGCTTVVNKWGCLVDDAGLMIAVTANGGTGNIVAGTTLTFTFAAPFSVTIPTRIGYGCMVNASGTMPQFLGTAVASGGTGVEMLAPIIAGIGSSAFTTPPSVGTSVGTLAAANAYYGYLA